jgi:hypothetical protein
VQGFDLLLARDGRVVERLVQLAQLGPFRLERLDADLLACAEGLLRDAVLFAPSLSLVSMLVVLAF